MRTQAQDFEFSMGMSSIWDSDIEPPTDPDLLAHFLAGRLVGEENQGAYLAAQNLIAG